jgi:hypothetical protein
MNTTTLIIPDIHGRNFWEKPCKEWDGPIIFLGDYFDPYPSEGINVEDAIENGKNLISFIKSRDNIITLAGNHDCHYIINDFTVSTRKSYEYLDEIKDLLNQIPLQLAHQIDNFLFTHAGVSKFWGDEISSFDGNTVDVLNSLFEKALNGNVEATYILGMVGRERGGYYKSGSCVWADIYETIASDPYKGFTQIVGHTQVKNVCFAKDLDPNYNSIYYVDCRKPSILTDNKIIEYEN